MLPQWHCLVGNICFATQRILWEKVVVVIDSHAKTLFYLVVMAQVPWEIGVHFTKPSQDLMG